MSRRMTSQQPITVTAESTGAAGTRPTQKGCTTMDMNFARPLPDGDEHPLERVFANVIEQVTVGKGERHGGRTIPFMDQLWVRTATDHGLGFLTGQAQKKMVEALQKPDQAAVERELLGALAYLGMAVIHLRCTNTWPGKQS